MTRVVPILFILGFLWVPFAWLGLAPLFADEPWQVSDWISLLVLAGIGFGSAGSGIA